MSEDNKPKKKNWKTTVAGIATAVGLIATQLGNLLDEDPATVVEWPVIVAALGAAGFGFFARDKDVSSKDSGVS